MAQWIHSFCSNVIFVIPVRYTFQSYSHSFVGIDNTSIFGLVFPNTAAGFPAAIYWCFTRHCCGHRNFKLSTRVFHGVCNFFIIWLKEEDTPWSSGNNELRFLGSPLLLCFAFRCIRHVLPHIWPYSVGSWACLFPRKSLTGTCVAYDFRASRRHTGTVTRCTPRRSPFQPNQASSWSIRRSHPLPATPRSRTATLELGGRSTFPALTQAWLHIEPSPCGGVRPASDPVDSDPGAVFEDDPHRRLSAVHSLEPWVCHHTREPTVLSRLSWRPSHLNIDRFHRPCLLPGRTSRIREDCHPRTTWRPLTLAGSPVLLPLRLMVSATPTRRYHGRTLIRPSPPACATQPPRCFAHAQVPDPRESAAACHGQTLGTPSPGHPSGDLWFNRMNLVKPVQESDNSLSPSMFQQSSICCSNNTSSDVWVDLTTSMLFNGIGNDSSLGTKSLTLGSTWWR